MQTHTFISILFTLNNSDQQANTCLEMSVKSNMFAYCVCKCINIFQQSTMVSVHFVTSLSSDMGFCPHLENLLPNLTAIFQIPELFTAGCITCCICVTQDVLHRQICFCNNFSHFPYGCVSIVLMLLLPISPV